MRGESCRHFVLDAEEAVAKINSVLEYPRTVNLNVAKRLFLLKKYKFINPAQVHTAEQTIAKLKIQRNLTNTFSILPFLETIA